MNDDQTLLNINNIQLSLNVIINIIKHLYILVMWIRRNRNIWDGRPRARLFKGY